MAIALRNPKTLLGNPPLILADFQEPRNVVCDRRRWKCRISLSLPTVTILKWQGAYYKNIGAADDPAVTGIQNPEPAWLRGKLPVNKCSQSAIRSRENGGQKCLKCKRGKG